MTYHLRRIVTIRRPPRLRWYRRLWRAACYRALRTWGVGRARVRHAWQRLGEWLAGGAR